MDVLLTWWKDWVLPARCRAAEGHQLADIGGEEIVILDPGFEELHEGTGMRSFDVWVAEHEPARSTLICTATSASGFRAAAETDGFAGSRLGAPRPLRLLLLADRSGDGDLYSV